MMDEVCAIDTIFADMIMRKFRLKNEGVRGALIKLMESARLGHVCIEDDGLLPQCLIGSGDDLSKLLVKRGSKIYFQRHYVLETKVLAALKKHFEQPMDQTRQVEERFLKGLNKQQTAAVSKSVTSSFFTLVGGPGTGKTFTAKRMIQAQGAGLRIAVSAPTGKAVAKLMESFEGLDVQAATLHRLLGVTKGSDYVKPAQKLPFDVILVDECSMIDLGIWGHFLDALLPATKVFLLGDPDQLPSVEPGNVFEEIWKFIKEHRPESGMALTQCMRTEQKGIMQAITSIRAKEMMTASDDFQIRWEMPEVETLISELDPAYRIANRSITALKSIQILSGLKSGLYGADRLNQAIWDRIAAELKEGDQIALPVLVTKNSKEMNLSNGQMGIWLHRFKDHKRIPNDDDMVVFDDRKIPYALMPGHDLGYVISVHKSQGSEYDHVKLILPPGSERFGRKVLYTAVTRARKEVEVFSDEQTLRGCVENASDRLSGLADRLVEMLS